MARDCSILLILTRRLGRGGYSASPDDALFKLMAQDYADRNPAMKASDSFKRGITNGADWYELNGTRLSLL